MRQIPQKERDESSYLSLKYFLLQLGFQRPAVKLRWTLLVFGSRHQASHSQRHAERLLRSHPTLTPHLRQELDYLSELSFWITGHSAYSIIRPVGKVKACSRGGVQCQHGPPSLARVSDVASLWVS